MGEKFKKLLPAYLVSASFVFVCAAFITNAVVKRLASFKSESEKLVEGETLERKTIVDPPTLTDTSLYIDQNWWLIPLIVVLIFTVFFFLIARLYKKPEEIE